MPHINIEIKARCLDQDSIRAVLQAHNAEYKGTDHQVDTYFRVPAGRLKLREGTIENALIFYVREDQGGPKQSNVTLHKVEPGSTLKPLLQQALGVLAFVDKEREIYFIENVKFHLDTVQGLGTFVEIEAIDTDGTLGRERLLEQCTQYLQLFCLKEEDLLEDSYSDQIMRMVA